MINQQFSSLNISQDKLDQYLVKTGYWGNEYLRERNNYVLSPCAYRVTSTQYEQLQHLGKVTFDAVEKMAQRISAFSQMPPRTRGDQMLVSMIRRSSKKLLIAQDSFDGSVPPVMKVDLVQDEYGSFHIAEVDAYNPRGLGFNALLDGNAHLDETVQTFGTMKKLAGLLHAFSPKGGVTFIVSEYERYYERSFMMLKNALVSFGIHMTLLREKDVADITYIVDMMQDISGGHVFMIPESLEDAVLRKNLLTAYKENDLQFFFPPKAYLGSKLLLPYYCQNDDMKHYLPETFLLSRHHDVQIETVSNAWLLKAGQSSGMKGIHFSDMQEETFSELFQRECTSRRPSYVLQKHIDQKPLILEMFNGNGVCCNAYYLRVIAQITRDGVIGLDVTGRMDRMVHGAKDCVMLPTIIEV